MLGSLFASKPRQLGFPHIDAFERDSQLHLEVSCPGLSKEDVNLQYDDRTETLSLTLNKESETKSKNAWNYEHVGLNYNWRISREMYDVENINAVMKNGLLRVTIPELPQEEQDKHVKKIEVR